MKITTTGVLILILSIVLIIYSLQRIKRETLGFRSGIIWIMMWGGIGFFSIFPEFLDAAVMLVKMKNRIFFILIVAVCVLFTVVFNLASRLDSIQRNLIKLSREIAIIRYKIENRDEQRGKKRNIS